jgi:hypothetical protein
VLLALVRSDADGASIQTQAADPLLDAASLRRYARAYASDAPLDPPLISPREDQRSPG